MTNRIKIIRDALLTARANEAITALAELERTLPSALKAKLASAESRIAELERANEQAHDACADLRTWFNQACEDIARMHDELTQLRGDAINLRDDLREPAEREGGLFAHFYGRVQRMLLAHPPPAPVAEIREVVVTDDMCERVFKESIKWPPVPGGFAMVRKVLAAWRAELGPTLGLVEIREPTPEECERICTEYERLLMRVETCGGRDAFDAVKAVMWPKDAARAGNGGADD